MLHRIHNTNAHRFPNYSREVIGTTLSTFASRSTVLCKWFLMDIPDELILGKLDHMTPFHSTSYMDAYDAHRLVR